MTYDCRSVLKHVLKCYDIFSDVHNNRKSCRGPVVSLVACDKVVPCKSALRDNFTATSFPGSLFLDHRNEVDFDTFTDNLLASSEFPLLYYT